MLRPILTLAALAHAATPTLRPVSVQELPTAPGAQYQSVLVTDAAGTPWTVRAALDPAAGAALEASVGLLRLLRTRMPFAVPDVAGTATGDDGTTVVVHPVLPGAPMVWRELVSGSDLARSVGAAVAALHDTDPRVVEEAGLPTYDADAYRARRLAALDRAASTGHVPPALLTRWERALEEVTLWKFATCVTHGTLERAHVLADGTVTAIDVWEGAGVADPAEDFAALLVLASPDAFDTVLEAYAGARRERPDVHLERRIRLSAELHRVTALLDAVAADDERLVDRRAAALRRFAETSADDDRLMPSPFIRQRPPAAVPVEPVDPADVEALDDLSGDDETVEIPITTSVRPSGAGGATVAPPSLTDGEQDADGADDDSHDGQEESKGSSQG
ncbi:phosphotransferase [Allobranchiibius huperziae]|uniref:Aminoglycoside phosphotransferase (APT) family kinase protein n=1 Tax=Allobranchiibius huperziae TaxID=1874116 RepID=A0A853DCX5_9MICO|nr:aminoglycoside phosphotransferase (APT) family kinase protein [Allobranchiibius huperziae]